MSKLITQSVQSSSTTSARGAIHPALDKVDIVLEIFSYLSETELVAVAQTSRAYFQAWIPFGWRIADEQRLVRLSNMAKHVEDVNCPCSTPEMSRRFQRYSASIQTLTMGYSGRLYWMNEIDPEQDKVLHNPQKYQIGRLKKFLVNVEALFILNMPWIPPLAYELVLPQLRSLHIDATSDNYLVAFLRHIRLVVPSLETFSVDGWSEPSNALTQSLLELAEVSLKLNYVAVFDAQNGVDIMDRCRDRLTELRIRYCDESPISLTIPNHLPMPRLEKFDLDIRAPDWVVLLSHLEAPLLSSVTITRHRVQEDARIWMRAFQLLPRDTIRQLTLKCNVRWIGVDDPHSLTLSVRNFDILAPLLRCHRLTHFKTNHDWPRVLVIEDADVAAMAAAWPELEVLTLYGLPDETKLTLRCLEPLHDYCPNLRNVTLNRLTPTYTTYTPRDPSYASNNPLTLRMHAFHLGRADQYLKSLWRNITVDLEG